LHRTISTAELSNKELTNPTQEEGMPLVEEGELN